MTGEQGRIAADQRAEEELADGLRRGAPEAVREVRERVRRIVGFRAYRIPRQDRKDLEQEVMSQLWQAVSRAGFDPRRGLWGLVEVVTARRCIDWLRGRRREGELDTELPDPAGGPLRSALAGERLRLARAALDQLAEPCRELIYLRVGLGKPYEELAGLLGRSEGALRVQMHRCVRQARRILARLEARPEAAQDPPDSTGAPPLKLR